MTGTQEMGSLSAQEFIHKWENTRLSEKAGSQSHFIDLCYLLDEDTPTEADPDGTWYTFEAGTTKTGGGHGWADVWKKDCFVWEYKRNHRDLTEAYKQLVLYSRELYNPPLLIVSDMNTIDIHTNFTNSIPKTHHLELESLEDPKNLNLLKQAFIAPEKLNPEKEREVITSELAKEFAHIARRLRERELSPHQVAHFINKIVFCLFAESIGLLPKEVFKRLLERGLRAPNELPGLLKNFFEMMRQGGDFGEHKIDWFNGGIFSDSEAFFLLPEEINDIIKVAKYDWSEVSATIFGQMFERGLDPNTRAQLGAHYTGKSDIIRIVHPVVLQPLQEKWHLIKKQCDTLLMKSKRNHKEANKIYSGFLEELKAIRVLDPACGSASFLYTTLQLLKDFELEVMCEAEKMGIRPREFPGIDPSCLLGIDTNEYAVELAKVTIWIGEIQWMMKNGFGLSKDPILKNLNNIEKRDALINPDGTEARWPDASFIVGSPPFLGDKKQISELGIEYVSRIRQVFKGRVPAGADFVTYWLEKSGRLVEEGKVKNAGFVTTNSIRGGQNQKVLDGIVKTCTIYNAWSDEPWIINSAAVRISIVCFSKHDKFQARPCMLNDKQVTAIYSNLEETNYGQTKALKENQNVSFMGITKTGPFDISGRLARDWLQSPLNLNGKPNKDVIFPIINGRDIVKRPSDSWLVDFRSCKTEKDASLYERPFEYTSNYVKPFRAKGRTSALQKPWWLHECSRPEMRKALLPFGRYIATSLVSKHRIFIWLSAVYIPSNLVIVIARDDDTTFGILHSKYHELWTLKHCTFLGIGNGPRYTPTTTFQTFPFPEGMTPNLPSSNYESNPKTQEIARIAKELNELRENWLNPPELVKVIPEVVSGYPNRILPINEEAEKVLKKRTLTNLYNENPYWLRHIHNELDSAVARAYGWPENLSDNEILEKLLQLNLERAKHQ
jgi:type II restriction/modification system DNA methylase subunit YeeA